MFKKLRMNLKISVIYGLILVLGLPLSLLFGGAESAHASEAKTVKKTTEATTAANALLHRR